MLLQKNLLTVGALAATTNQPIHRIEYLLKTRGIACVYRAGRYRLYDDQALNLLKESLTSSPRQAVQHAS